MTIGHWYEQVTQFTIPVTPPFRFDLALCYLQRSPDEIIDLIREERHYRVVPGSRGPALLEISAPDNADGTSLSVRVLDGEVDPESVQATISTLYQSYATSQGIELTEPLAVKLHRHFRGLPVVQALTPWEALVWAIIGQQINIAFAYRLKRAFVENFGERVAYNGHTYFAFPEPDTVAALEHERHLLPIQFSRQKSRYIIEAARSILNGDLDFERIAQLDDDAASEALQRQLGVGRWTAEYILLRGFGRLNVIPAGDAALKALVGQHQDLGRAANEDEVRSLAERWIPRRGETAFMLWFAKQSGWFKR